MGVIHDRRYSLGRMDGLETACHRHEATHIDKHLLGIPAEQNRGSIDSRQVVGVETSGEKNFHFVAVELHQSSVKPAFDDASGEIGVFSQ